MRGRGGLLLAPSVVLLVLAFAIPVGMLVPTSFRPYVPLVGITSGFTVRYYTKLVTDSYYLEIIGRTLGLGLTVTALTLVIGYPVAFFLARTRSRWRGWLTILVVFPLLLNLVVRTFGWIALLAQNGLVNQAMIALGLVHAPVALLFNFAGLLIGLTHIFLPFMVLVLVGAIQNIPRDVEDAARVLGASWAGAFARVTLPLSLPGVLSGSILVFVLTISALVTPRLLGGPTYQVMSTLIYDEFLQRLNWPAGSAQALLLTADGARARLPLGPLRPADGSARVSAARVRAWLLRAWVTLVFGFLLLPVVVVALASFSRTSYLTVPPQGVTLRWFGAVLADPEYVHAIVWSVGLAVVATVGSLTAGVAASYALIRRRVRGGALVSALLNAPLIFPGVVVGVALLQFYALVRMNGTFASLALAHMVITLPYVVRAVMASLQGIDPEIESAARVLGASGPVAFFTVTLPLIRPGVAAGALFSFIVSFDNVPVSIFLLGAGQMTLPVKIFTAIEYGVDPSIAAISTMLIVFTGLGLAAAERWVGFHRFV